jgi:hypothetical protein
MRDFEIITETTEEDRAIISLGTAIYGRLKHFEDQEPDTDDVYNSDYDDYDPDADIDDEPKPDDELIVVGKVGELFDTPLGALNGITIELQSTYGINERMRKDEGSDVTTDPKTGVIMGLWYPVTSTMVLNKDYLGSNALRSTVAHELRHALDDYKSDFRANASTKYRTPKNPDYREVTKDPVLGDVNYLAEPAEINARLVQVLVDMTSVISRAAKLEPKDADALIDKYLKQSMKNHKITSLFPEKEKSKDYKRIMKRVADFIDKELTYQRKSDK